MANIAICIQLLAIAVLTVTLFALALGVITEEPASVAVAVSLLGQLGAAASSLPFLGRSQLEKDAISHLKEKRGRETKRDFDRFLDDLVKKQDRSSTFESLKQRGIISEETVTRNGSILQEVKLRLRARLA